MEIFAGTMAVFGGIFVFVTGIIWLIVGWRAMRAHEEIAERLVSLQRDAREIAKFLANRR